MWEFLILYVVEFKYEWNVMPVQIPVIESTHE